MRPRKFAEPVNAETVLSSMCRGQTQACVDRLIGIMTSQTAKDSDVINAIKVLLDRGWGKAVERHMVEGQDGQRLMRIVHEFVHLEPRPQLELVADNSDRQ